MAPCSRAGKVTAFGQARDSSHLASVGSNWFGIGIHRSSDFESWAETEAPPVWPEGPSFPRIAAVRVLE